MATDFTRTTRSLAADRFTRGGLVITVVALLFAGWLAWLFVARVTLHELSATCRLEIEGAVHPVMNRVAGEVIATQLEIGHEVSAGDVLLRLDARAQELAMAEAEAALADYEARSLALSQQIEAEAATECARAAAEGLAIAAAHATQKESEARADVAARHADSQRELLQQQIVGELAAREATAKADAASAASEATRLHARERELQDHAAAQGHLARVAALRREAVELHGKAEIERARRQRLAAEIEQRTVRAPAAGRLGDVREVRVGAVLAAAERLATIVPLGKTRVVAEFAAAAAGRLGIGQRATLRMDGFPWARFGTLTATVERVASEPVQGRLRVEMQLAAEDNARIPLTHGLPGIAEVEVERVSPADLLLRAAGRLVASESRATVAAATVAAR